MYFVYICLQEALSASQTVSRMVERVPSPPKETRPPSPLVQKTVLKPQKQKGKL